MNFRLNEDFEIEEIQFHFANLSTSISSTQDAVIAKEIPSPQHTQ